MRCPTLNELPPPPPGKTGWPCGMFTIQRGWPWTEETPQIADSMPDGKSYPKISIITPNYNYGRFLEETIRSVVLQGYPNLEYIIIDGNSTDNSVEIIKKYAKWFAYWVSEPDTGQTDAINKGFKMITGDIVAWINADDTYAKGALKIVSIFFNDNPHISMIYGACNLVDINSNVLNKYPTVDFNIKKLISDWNYIPQPATFFKKKVLNEVGLLDTSFNFSMDREFFIRIGKKYKIKRIQAVLGNVRIHDCTKTKASGKKGIKERLLICKKYGGFLFFLLPLYSNYYMNRLKKLMPVIIIKLISKLKQSYFT